MNWHYRWMEAAQVDPNFSVYLILLLLHVSLLQFPPFSYFHQSPTLYRISSSSVKIFTQWRLRAGSHRQSWGRNWFPAGGMKAVIKQQDFFFSPAPFHLNSLKDSSPPLTFTRCSAEPAWRTGLAWDSKRFKAFLHRRKKSLYPEHLLATRKRLNSKQRAADICWQRSFHLILASYASCLVEKVAWHNIWATPARLSFVKWTETKHSRPQRKPSYSP